MARKKRRRQAVEKAPTILKVLFQEEVTPNRYDDVEAFAESAVGPGMLMRTIRGWRVAKSLDRLLAQVNRLALPQQGERRRHWRCQTSKP